MTRCNYNIKHRGVKKQVFYSRLGLRGRVIGGDSLLVQQNMLGVSRNGLRKEHQRRLAITDPINN